MAAPYPLSLETAQVQALRQWRASDGYDAFQHVVRELAQNQLERVVNTDVNTVERERGALTALKTVHDVVDTILKKCEEIDARTNRNGEPVSTRKSPTATFWGSPFWDWKRGS